MMIGLAQVMAMKPILRFGFSNGPAASAAIAVMPSSGRNCEIAASAVEAPTALRKERRWRASGNTARSAAERTTSLIRASPLVLETPWAPQPQDWPCTTLGSKISH